MTCLKCQKKNKQKQTTPRKTSLAKNLIASKTVLQKIKEKLRHFQINRKFVSNTPALHELLKRIL